MKDIIARIIELDRMEQQLTLEAEEMKFSAENDMQKRKFELKNEYFVKARERIEKNSKILMNEMEEEWQVKLEQNKADKDMLIKLKEKNFEDWVEKIYNKVLNEL